MTDPTMRERVARAIAEAHMKDFDELPNLHLAMADAAIGAMREPGKALIVAGERAIDDAEDAYTDTFGNPGDFTSNGDYAYACWTAMIDTALAEKP